MQVRAITKGKPQTITATVSTTRPEKICLVVQHPLKPHTKFLTRNIVVNGTRKIEFPIITAPDDVLISAYNYKNRDKGLQYADPTFKVKWGKEPLKTWIYAFTQGDKDFIEFAQQFCDNAGIYSTGIYGSDRSKYRIKYVDQIRSSNTGAVISTPARINNKTKEIEVSRQAFLNYSIPMRMIILLHEYCHGYKNSNMRDEIQADLNALYLYLSLGYSRVEAHRAFIYVFKNADNEPNQIRYAQIAKYIKDFDSGKIATPNEINKMVTIYSGKK